jgi:hypothetical protein
MQKFRYGNAAIPGVYFDEENRRRLNIIKMAHLDIAQNLFEAGRKEEAKKVLEHYDANVSQANFPYGMTTNLGNVDDRSSAWLLELAYACGDRALALKVSASLKKDLQQQLHYYRSLGEAMPDEQLAINAQQAMQGKNNSLSEKQMEFVADIVSSYQLLRQIADIETQYSAILLRP